MTLRKFEKRAAASFERASHSTERYRWRTWMVRRRTLRSSSPWEGIEKADMGGGGGGGGGRG